MHDESYFLNMDWLLTRCFIFSNDDAVFFLFFLHSSAHRVPVMLNHVLCDFSPKFQGVLGQVYLESRPMAVFSLEDKNSCSWYSVLWRPICNAHRLCPKREKCSIRRLKGINYMFKFNVCVISCLLGSL